MFGVLVSQTSPHRSLGSSHRSQSQAAQLAAAQPKAKWSGRRLELSASPPKASSFQMQTPADSAAPTAPVITIGPEITIKPDFESVEWLPPIEQYQVLLRKFVTGGTSSVEQLARKFKAEFESFFHSELQKKCDHSFVESRPQAKAWIAANIEAGDLAREKAIDMFRPDVVDNDVKTAFSDAPTGPVDPSDIEALNKAFSELCSTLQSFYPPRFIWQRSEA